ncbi:MAG TPA: hypothetical protein VKB95_00970, partial [Chitinophagaceae bacterium]|nr:hypothetical protein [Chitinophagaceae bacterium]
PDTVKVQRLLKICDQLIVSLSKLSNAADEQSIPLLKSEAESAYHKFESKKAAIDTLNLAVSNQTIKDFIKKALQAYTKAPKIIERTEMTSKPVLPIVVEDNEMLIVTIVRYKGLSIEKKWKVEIKGSEPSPWKFYYGFTFAPNRWNNFKSYYLKTTEVSNVVYSKDGLGNVIDTTVTTATKYAITEKHNQNRFWADLSPTVLFTYRPFEKKKCDFGITAGLSTDLNTRAALFLGASLVIGDNINLNLGYGAIKKNMLKGEYEEGQLLNESNVALEESQCMGGVMISLGFRFDKKTKTSTSSNQSNSTAEENISHDTDSSEEENSGNNSPQPSNSNTTNTSNSPPPGNTGENSNNGNSTDDSFTNPHR